MKTTQEFTKLLQAQNLILFDALAEIAFGKRKEIEPILQLDYYEMVARKALKTSNNLEIEEEQ